MIPSFQKNDSVDDFEIIDKLGKQHHRKFNEVLLVRHKKTGILGVCKKLVKSDKKQHLIPLLRQEADISFSGRGLPKTIAYFENDEEIILIRNYQEGVPLDEFWKGIPRRERMDFIVSLLQKLIPVFDVMKENGIVHGDIKPSNIIVSGTKNEFEAGLIDFGIAIRKEKNQDRKTLFALGYSAPELILNKLDLVDASTDIFSLGISLWQLFTGKLPLMHPNPGIMTNLQITHPLPENSAIPKEFWEILAKMCNKHVFQLPPNKMQEQEVEMHLKEAMQLRFQDLGEILKALEYERSKRSGFQTWLDSMKRKK